MANYTLNQGETFRVTLELQDSDSNPVRLADENAVALVFFAGVATLGTETQDISFRMQPVNTITYGRGAANGRVIAEGVFKLYAFIPADITISMTAGDWAYEIRQAGETNPVDLDAVTTVLEGTITIKDGPLDNSLGANFIFTAPLAP